MTVPLGVSRPTTVINIRRGERYDVYIGRAGQGQDGYFGNPVVLGRPCPVCREVHNFRGGAVACFEVYARRRILRDPEFRRRVAGLRGLALGCFCAPDSCHGDVYVVLAEELAQEAA